MWTIGRLGRRARSSVRLGWLFVRCLVWFVIRCTSRNECLVVCRLVFRSFRLVLTMFISARVGKPRFPVMTRALTTTLVLLLVTAVTSLPSVWVERNRLDDSIIVCVVGNWVVILLFSCLMLGLTVVTCFLML